jgi:hypothetical protein
LANNAIIGYSGFVGSNIVKQTSFEVLYRSTNVHEIKGRSFDTIVCAGAPGQKWVANQYPERDSENIDSLIEHLKSIRCKTFVLISTVDVFKNACGVDEQTLIVEEGLNAYGLHRRRLETFVENNFSNYLIVRLPGLVGPGLRKNVIFDLLHKNNLHLIESRAVFQFYPMVNLWFDIQVALKAGLRLIHLTAAPISVAEVSGLGFGKPFSQELAGVPAAYDMCTLHSRVFGTEGNYQYLASASIQAIRTYAQSELVKAPPVLEVRK